MKKSTDSPLYLGRISGLFGVRGWVKVFSETSPREQILHYDPWILRQQGGERVCRVKQGRRQGKSVVVQLEGYADRTTAEALLGAEIYILPGQREPLDHDEYYWSDLIGCQVSNQQQELLGEVDHLLETGANDVLVVKRHNRQQLIPFTDPWIVSIDIENQSIVVDWESDF
jgi:16S rRNA processing protein RimM